MIKTGKTEISTNYKTKSDLIPSDILIPKLLLMQGLSDYVANGQAVMGDIVRSTTGEKLGDASNPIEFIPLTAPVALWGIEVKEKGKFKWKRDEPRNAKNAQDEWNYLSDENGYEDGRGKYEARRVQKVTLFALVVKDIQADEKERKKAENGEFPDLSKALMPVQISFSSYSFKNAGKKIVSYFAQAASFRAQPWKGILTLGCFKDENDNGKFYVYDLVGNPKPVKKEDYKTVEYWVNTVNNTAVNIDNQEVPVQGDAEDVPF